jgi:hypothetical protein
MNASSSSRAGGRPHLWMPSHRETRIAVAIATREGSDGTAYERTLASVAGHVDGIHAVTGDDLGATRSAVLAQCAAHGDAAVVLSLEAGEVVSPSAWEAIAAFASGSSAIGRLGVVDQREGESVRRILPRLVRVQRGATFVGRLVDHPVSAGAVEDVAAVLLCDRSTHVAPSRARLEAELTRSPMDAALHLALADALFDDDPGAAADEANAAVACLDVDSAEMPSAVVALARALFAARRFDEVLGIAEACRGRFETLVTLTLLEARALAALGRAAPMVRAFERCLGLGERANLPGIVGAGSFLPALDLARFAEARGDRATARRLYALALSFAPDLAAASEAVKTLDAATKAPHAASAQSSGAAPPSSRERPLKVVACIPGREFSGRFFDAWNEFVARCHASGIELTVSRRYDAVVYYARNKVAGGSVKLGPKQAPWAGEVDYDYMLWIDSDVMFTFEDFQALLRHKVDVAAGLYLMADNARFAAVERMDPKVFAAAGEFEFLTPAAVAERPGLFAVDYCGFGFMLIRRGVFERLTYPWFRPIYFEAPSGAVDFTSEDVGFCLEARKAGIAIHVDPKVIVGHEKPVVLDPRGR